MRCFFGSGHCIPLFLQTGPALIQHGFFLRNLSYFPEGTLPSGLKLIPGLCRKDRVVFSMKERALEFERESMCKKTKNFYHNRWQAVLM
jgi:hypothetical protein